MSRALEKLLVLDCTTEFWSSLGVAMLGDFGADVIRIERLPRTPGGARSRTEEEPARWDHRRELAHRNKLGLALRLDAPEGREIFHALVRRADVFVTDEPTAVLGAEQRDYAALSSLKPDLLYVRGSGFGPQGPDRDLPPLDEIAAARTGMMPILPQPGEPPVYPGAGQMYSTVMLGFGIMTALAHRDRTGEGQEVDVSLFAGNMYGASLDLQAYLAMGGERLTRPVSRLDAGNPMSGTLYPSKDGRWVTLTMPDTDRWWPGFADLVGLETDDPRFDSHEKRCEENRLELMQILEEAFRRQTGDHWRRVFAERKLSADVIEDYSFAARDPQVSRNRYILDLEHPSLGPMRMVGFPIFMSDSPARLDRTAPCLGQHSAAILHDLLGFSEDRIQELAAEGVIA